MTSTIKTALIIGGSVGLGLEYAKHLKALGKRVIVTGRPSSKNLADVAKSGSGLETYGMDVADLASLPGHLKTLFEQNPDLNSVWINVGIQHTSDLTDLHSTTDAKVVEEITVNVTGPLILARHIIDHLLALPEKGKGATIYITSSGLGFVPNKIFPVYCATKAAVHSYAVAARQALQDTGVSMIELAPPLVLGTQLGADWRVPGNEPHGMSLEDYTKETFDVLDKTPAKDLKEVPAGSARPRVDAWRAGSGKLLIEMGLGG